MPDEPKSMSEVAVLMRQSLPDGVSPSEFGERIGWGRGSDEALARIESLTTEELKAIGLTGEAVGDCVRRSGSPDAGQSQCSRPRRTHATRRQPVGRRVTMAMASSSTGQAVRLRNKTDRPQQLWLEPLGDFVVLEPNGLYEVTVTDDLDEIDLSTDGFTIYGWVEKVSEVAADGGLTTVWKLAD